MIEKMKTMIPPPVYMLIFALLMWLSASYFPVADIIVSPWHRLGYVLIGIGLSIDLYSLGLFILASTTLNPLKPGNASQLVVKGMYRFTRNPMYLGLVFLLFGWAFLLGVLGAFVWPPLLILLLNQMQIIPEEEVLAEKFGQDYLDYKKQVRRWI